MALIGRPKAELILSSEEEAELRRLSRRRKTSQAMATRARIVLGCSRGKTSRDVAEEIGVSDQTVCKWRKRFVERRLEGLFDEPRVGAPRRVTDRKVEEVVEKTLHTKPANATHWSSYSLAQEVGVSSSTVQRVWRAFGLQPHRSETFSLSRDPQFVDKVRDIVGLYMSPPTNALVLCVDEKSQIQALDRSQPGLPMMKTFPQRQTHTYKRHGTTSLFAALDVATGRVIGKCFRRHRSQEFKKFLAVIDEAVPKELDVHLIMDNYATHKSPPIQRWLLRNPRFHVHFTPTSSSWLNMVESWFALLSKRILRRGVHRSTRALEKAIKAFLDENNEDPSPFVWTKSADDILDNLRRYCEAVDRHQSAKSNSTNF